MENVTYNFYKKYNFSYFAAKSLLLKEKAPSDFYG